MANSLKVLPVVTVGLTPVQLTQDKTHKWHSVSIQSDPSNSGTIYIGSSSAVSPTLYSRALQPGDWFASEGSAIDPSNYWIVATAAGQVAAISGN